MTDILRDDVAQIAGAAPAITSAQERLERRVYYAQAVFGEAERQAVLATLDNPWLASGPVVRSFEARVAAAFARKHGLAVNSGSSANLLALHALGLPGGTEVVTPACTFATTVAPLVQLGLRPVFVDTVLGSYTADLDQVQAAIGPRTSAILVPQLLGSVNDMTRLRRLADRHGLRLVDDCCDTFAPTLRGSAAGHLADMTTTSFYGSHVITAMGVGGMILSDDAELIAVSARLRDWGRAGDDREAFDVRFDYALDDVPYDAKFAYVCWGYNMKLSEASAAFGLVQLERLPEFRNRRAAAFEKLLACFAEYGHWFHLPAMLPGVGSSWLAFPLTIRCGAPFTRYELLKCFEAAGIQTRVLFSGNITRHPACKGLDYRAVSSLANADHVMAGGFLLGCHQGMDRSAVDYVCTVARRFLSSK